MAVIMVCISWCSSRIMTLSALSPPSSFTAFCPLSEPGHLWKLMTSLSTSSSSTPGFYYHHVDPFSSISNTNLNGGKADERVWDQIKEARFSTLILLLLVCHHSESFLLSIKCSMNSIHTEKEDRRMKKRERVREKNERGEEGRGKRDRGLVRQTALCLDYHWSLCPIFPLSLSHPLFLLHALLLYPSCIPRPIIVPILFFLSFFNFSL